MTEETPLIYDLLLDRGPTGLLRTLVRRREEQLTPPTCLVQADGEVLTKNGFTVQKWTLVLFYILPNYLEKSEEKRENVQIQVE